MDTGRTGHLSPLSLLSGQPEFVVIAPEGAATLAGGKAGKVWQMRLPRCADLRLWPGVEGLRSLGHRDGPGAIHGAHVDVEQGLVLVALVLVLLAQLYGRRTRPTSTGCRNPWQPEPGRAPLMGAKAAVQTNGLTSVVWHGCRLKRVGAAFPVSADVKG